MIHSRRTVLPSFLAVVVTLCFLPNTFSLFGDDNKGFSRINPPGTGVDLLVINNAETIQKVISSGDLVRIDEACPDVNDVQWLLRNFFANSRFYSKPFGYFLAMKEKTTLRPYLDKMLQPGAFDVTNYAKEAAGILLDQKKNAKSDKALEEVWINAIGSRFLSGGKPYPTRIIDEARKSYPDLVSSLNISKRKRSRKAAEKCCTFVRDEMVKTGDANKYNLSKSFPVDCVHPVFAGLGNGLDSLRTLAEDPSLDVEIMMCRREKSTKNIPRMVMKDSTLGGLLPEDKPIIGRKTVVLLNIRNAARETDDVSYAFGTGSKKRRCAAEPAILEFLKAVQKEILSRTD